MHFKRMLHWSLRLEKVKIWKWTCEILGDVKVIFHNISYDMHSGPTLLLITDYVLFQHIMLVCLKISVALSVFYEHNEKSMVMTTNCIFNTMQNEMSPHFLTGFAGAPIFRVYLHSVFDSLISFFLLLSMHFAYWTAPLNSVFKLSPVQGCARSLSFFMYIQFQCLCVSICQSWSGNRSPILSHCFSIVKA